MQARCSAIVLLAMLAAPVTAGAEPGHARGITLGLGAVQPLPPWNDAGFGLAPWAGFFQPVSARWSITARVGWMVHMDREQSVGSSPKETIRYEHWELPVLVGAEFSGRGDRGLLLSGELGYVLRGARADYAHEPDASSIDHGAGVAIGGGYRIGDLRARLQWFLLGLPDGVKHKVLMLDVQWLFPL